MKKSSPSRALGIVILGLFLGFSAPSYAQDTDMLNQAIDLVHKAWNPGDLPPSNADRITWLTQALKLAQNAPQKRTHGFREKAIHEIQAALFELKQGDPNNKASDFIRDADSDLRTALSTVE